MTRQLLLQLCLKKVTKTPRNDLSTVNNRSIYLKQVAGQKGIAKKYLWGKGKINRNLCSLAYRGFIFDPWPNGCGSKRAQPGPQVHGSTLSFYQVVFRVPLFISTLPWGVVWWFQLCLYHATPSGNMSGNRAIKKRLSGICVTLHRGRKILKKNGLGVKKV